MQTLAYKRNLDAVLARLEDLWARRTPDRILATMGVPSEAIARFAAEHPDGFCGYPDPQERVAFWDAYLRERSEVEDDSIPSVYLNEFDQGLYGGLLGGEVQFMCHPDNGRISSMVAPILRGWDDLPLLATSRDKAWTDRYLARLDLFRAAADGKFGISHFILIDGLNLCFELVGATDTYRALFDRPEDVRHVIDMAYELNLWVQRTFFERAPLLRGGTCSNMVQWLPGRIVSESVDPFHMTSVAYFEAWGREPAERMLAQFDGGVLHIHGNGRHLLEAVRSMRGLKAIYLLDDRGYPAALDVLQDLQARCQDVPLVVATEWEKFVERLTAGTLPGGVLYKVDDAPDIYSANRLMERVHAYRA